MIVFARVIKWLLNKSNSQMRVLKAFSLVFFLNIVFGLMFYWAEHSVQEDLSIMDSIWWAMVTMTTVGYGDYYAQTFVGRFFVSYPCFLLGIGLLAYLIGVIADAMIQRVSRKRRGLMRIDLEGHVIICHYPNQDRVIQMIKELKLDSRYKDRKFVLITPDLDELPEVFIKHKCYFIKGDPVRQDILEKANITKADGVIILAKNPNDINSDITTYAIGSLVGVMAKEHNAKIKIIAELLAKVNQPLLENSHADGLVSNEGIGDNLIVQEFLFPGIQNVIQQLITNTEGSQFYIYDTILTGIKFQKIQVEIINHPTNLQLLGIIRDNKPKLNPSKEMIIKKGDRLILIAENSDDFREIEKDILSNQVE